MTVPVCYYGSPEPLPPWRELRAGPLTAVYEAGDLRYVRVGGVEVCRRWYAAVRDADWGTLPGVITDERIDEHEAGFRVSYTSTHRRGDIHFVWRAEILATAGGITFIFDGEAKSTFRRNRIGFCILHPVRECAGAGAKLFHPDDTTTDTEFPRLIAPHNPFKELAGLTHDLPGGGSAEWWFDGDVFETEDQRNWTDASFKTFCTPLRLPFPVEVPAGTRVRQVVTLAVRGTVPAHPRSEARDTFAVGSQPSHLLPQIGLRVADHGQPLTKREHDIFRELRPAHLRVDLELWADKEYPTRLRRAAEEAAALGIGLEAALTVSDNAAEDLEEFVATLHQTRPLVRRWLVFDWNEWSTPAGLVALARRELAGYDSGIPVYTGTLANFTELNRGRPPVEQLDGVCFSIHPQVHAFDNRSLVETCAALADVVESARAFCGTLPIHVTPVTLKARLNPYATGPTPPTPPGELPPQVDVRQMSLFGAGWTLTALKYLAESGVAGVTFYETTGWLGVMEREAGCPLPDQFPSRPGMVFPLFHVLADVNFLTGGRVVPSRSSDPLAFDGLALRRGDSLRVLLANLTDRPRTVIVAGLGPRASVQVLDETTFDRATVTDVEGFRTQWGDEQATTNDTLVVPLRPYAYARLDTTVPA
jgi:hypothetical protein